MSSFSNCKADEIESLKKSVSKAKMANERVMDLYVNGVIDGPDAITRIQDTKRRLEQHEAELAVAAESGQEPEIIQDAEKLYLAAITKLTARLNSAHTKFPGEALEALRVLVSHIIVFPKVDDCIPVEIVGDMAALISGLDEKVVGAMVAEEGLEPPTRGL